MLKMEMHLIAAVVLFFYVRFCLSWVTPAGPPPSCSPVVNCEWGEWSSATHCSASCGNGTQVHTRTHNVFASCGGRHCEGSSSKQATCNVKCCRENCVWGPWSPSRCSVTCGKGRAHRTRQKIVQEACGGHCRGRNEEVVPCDDSMPCCPVNCTWSSWTYFSLCSVSCGTGTKRRTRGVASQASCGGLNCTGPNVQTDTCDDGCCPQDCVTHVWGAFGPCSATCGRGWRSRTRTVITVAKCGGDCHNLDHEVCSTQTCPVLCPWGEWDACHKTCGKSKQIRRRVKPDASDECLAGKIEERVCNLTCCPVDCKYSSWSSWNECNKSCGSGSQFRERNESVPSVCDGLPCIGPTRENQTCNDQLCNDRKGSTTFLKAGSGSKNNQVYIIPVAVIAATAVLLIGILVFRRYRQRKPGNTSRNLVTYFNVDNEYAVIEK